MRWPARQTPEFAQPELGCAIHAPSEGQPWPRAAAIGSGLLRIGNCDLIPAPIGAGAWQAQCSQVMAAAVMAPANRLPCATAHGCRTAFRNRRQAPKASVAHHAKPSRQPVGGQSQSGRTRLLPRACSSQPMHCRQGCLNGLPWRRRLDMASRQGLLCRCRDERDEGALLPNPAGRSGSPDCPAHGSAITELRIRSAGASVGHSAQLCRQLGVGQPGGKRAAAGWFSQIAHGPGSADPLQALRRGAAAPARIQQRKPGRARGGPGRTTACLAHASDSELRPPAQFTGEMLTTRPP